jgi:hypothetical protein
MDDEQAPGRFAQTARIVLAQSDVHGRQSPLKKLLVMNPLQLRLESLICPTKAPTTTDNATPIPVDIRWWLCDS